MPLCQLGYRPILVFLRFGRSRRTRTAGLFRVKEALSPTKLQTYTRAACCYAKVLKACRFMRPHFPQPDFRHAPFGRDLFRLSPGHMTLPSSIGIGCLLDPSPDWDTHYKMAASKPTSRLLVVKARFERAAFSMSRRRSRRLSYSTIVYGWGWRTRTATDPTSKDGTLTVTLIPTGTGMAALHGIAPCSPP